MYDSWYKTGERIKVCRGKRSQDSLCDEIERVTGDRPKRGTLASWESGKTCPTLKQLRALSKIFGVDVSYLLGDCDTKRMENREYVRELGLSEIAVNVLRKMKKDGAEDSLEMLSALIESEFDFMNFGPNDAMSMLIFSEKSLLDKIIDLCIMKVEDSVSYDFSKYQDLDMLSDEDIFEARFMSLSALLREFIMRQRQKGWAGKQYKRTPKQLNIDEWLMKDLIKEAKVEQTL